MDKKNQNCIKGYSWYQHLRSCSNAVVGVLQAYVSTLRDNFKIMIVKIDTTIWTTQSQYAKSKGESRQTINNWIRRGKVEVWHIEELGLKLIKK